MHAAMINAASLPACFVTAPAAIGSIAALARWKRAAQLAKAISLRSFRNSHERLPGSRRRLRGRSADGSQRSGIRLAQCFERHQRRDPERRGEQKNRSIRQIVTAGAHHASGDGVADRGIARIAAEPSPNRAGSTRMRVIAAIAGPSTALAKECTTSATMIAKKLGHRAVARHLADIATIAAAAAVRLLRVRSTRTPSRDLAHHAGDRAGAERGTYRALRPTRAGQVDGDEGS